jgi:hypothetical protein
MRDPYNLGRYARPVLVTKPNTQLHLCVITRWNLRDAECRSADFSDIYTYVHPFSVVNRSDGMSILIQDFGGLIVPRVGALLTSSSTTNDQTPHQPLRCRLALAGSSWLSFSGRPRVTSRPRYVELV